MAGKADIVTAMADKAGISKKEAEAAYEAMLEHVVKVCLESGRCAVPGRTRIGHRRSPSAAPTQPSR